jgi:hypothetical protein
MKIRGFFNQFGAPWVPVHLRRKDDERVLRVPFIIDTAAYRSMVGPRVIYSLKVSIHELRKSVGQAVGFGGLTQFYFLQNVDLTFDTDQGPHTEPLTEIMTTFGPYTGVHRKRPHVHSILGRDILDRYALIMDKRAGVVMLTDEQVVGWRSPEAPVEQPEEQELMDQPGEVQMIERAVSEEA